MTDDRNRTVHTYYNEAVAEAIFARISSYVDLIDDGLAAMEQRLGDLTEGRGG